MALVTSQQGIYDEAEDAAIIEGWERCYLKATICQTEVQFYYAEDMNDWKPIGSSLYSGVLADEYMKKLSFTGAFAGVCVQDLNGTRMHADFDFFDYVEKG